MQVRTLSARLVRMIGTRRVEEETERKAARPVFGDNPSGVITYTSDGRMSTFHCQFKKKACCRGRTVTDAEAADLYRTMVTYSGAYAVNGNKITHKIEVSRNQAWSGADQQRFVEIKDNQLTIKTIVSPISGKESYGSGSNSVIVTA
jgi:hypothetical protein